jgi:glutathione S-transferase
MALEDWADESIVPNARKVMIGAFKQHPNFRTSLLPATTPDVLRNLVGAVPGDLLNLVGTGVGFGPDDIKAASTTLKQNLESICHLLQGSLSAGGATYPGGLCDRLGHHVYQVPGQSVC